MSEEAIKLEYSPKGKSKTTWEKRTRNEDGSSIEEVVEEVSNGFIKTVTTSGEKNNEYYHEVVKSIHKDNPMEELSVMDKLERFLKER